MRRRMDSVPPAVLLAGILLLAIGYWFAGIKAGIPYQDPTPEMQIHWLAYARAGDICLGWGGGLTLLGGVGWLILRRKK